MYEVRYGLAWLWAAVLTAVVLSGIRSVSLGAEASAFPDVPLVAGAQPLYAALALDEKGERAAFVLFDGTAEAGYGRAYIWMPGHTQYGRPVAISSDGNGTFPPIGVPAGGESPVDTTWQLRVWIEERGAAGERMVKYHDYATGRTIEHKEAAREAMRVPRFAFKVRYRHGGAYARDVAGATDLTDIGIDGSLPVGSKWAERPAPFAPWNQLYLQGSVDLQRGGEDPDGGIMKVSVALVHNPHERRPCQIVSLLKDSRVNVEIFHYMEDPLVSESLSAAQALSAGFTSPVAFGWYQFRLKWNGGGLGVQPFTRGVFPFGRQ